VAAAHGIEPGNLHDRAVVCPRLGSDALRQTLQGSQPKAARRLRRRPLRREGPRAPV